MSQRKDMNDLDYLSEQGYEFTGAELSPGEQARMRKKLQMGRQGAFLRAAASVGFLLLSCFLYWYLGDQKEELKVSDTTAEKLSEKTIELDTLVVSEKFLIPSKKVIVAERKELREEEEAVEPEILPSGKVIAIAQDSIPVPSFKFAYNAQVHYVRDLKICNYYTTFFKGGRNLPLGRHTEAENDQDPKVERVLGKKDRYVHEILEEAMISYRKEKYQECINALGLIEESIGEEINCRFYRGMCYLQMKKYSQAIELLKWCSENNVNVFHEEASFYLAFCYKESGNTSEAERLLGKIRDNKGFYSERAADLITD